MKNRLVVLVFCLLLLSLTGCGKKDNQEFIATPKIMDFEALNDIKEGRPNVYVILKLVNSDYWQVILDGVTDSSKVLNCNVYYAATNNETDWQSQHILIEKAYKNGADALILSPNDSVMLSDELEKIHNDGIPIVLIDTAVNNDVFDICYMTDNYIAGTKAAQEMITLLEEKGHESSDSLQIGVLVGSASSQTINERLAGFFQYWEDHAPQNWTILSDIKNSNGDADAALSLANDFLERYSSIAGLYGTNNGPTKALCKTVMEAGRKDIVVMGFDYSDEMKSMIESPDYSAATMLQRQYDMGFIAMKRVRELLNGENIRVKYVDTGVIAVKLDVLNNPDVVEALKHN